MEHGDHAPVQATHGTEDLKVFLALFIPIFATTVILLTFIVVAVFRR